MKLGPRLRRRARHVLRLQGDFGLVELADDVLGEGISLGSQLSLPRDHMPERQSGTSVLYQKDDKVALWSDSAPNQSRRSGASGVPNPILKKFLTCTCCEATGKRSAIFALDLNAKDPCGSRPLLTRCQKYLPLAGP